MAYRGGLVLGPTHDEAPVRDRPNLNRASRFLLLPAVAGLVLVATLFDVDVDVDVVGPNNLILIQSLFAVAVVAFNAAMIAVLLPLAPFAEAISPTVASRLERAAAVGSVTTLLVATALLFVSVAVARD